MKNIKVSSYTLYFLLLFFLCGLIKEAIIIFIIVMIHELGHVLMINHFHFKIKSINIYPFGGYTIVYKKINTLIKIDLLISIGGFMSQIIFFFFIFLLSNTNLLSDLTISLLYKYNFSIFLFNLIPIYPLDGGIILNLGLNKLFSYRKSYYLTFILSIIMLFIYVMINYYYSLNNYLIVIFLLTKIINYFQNYEYLYNQFLLERYLDDFKYLKIKNNYESNLKVLKKDTLFYFYDDYRWVNEKELLKNRFDN